MQYAFNFLLFFVWESVVISLDMIFNELERPCNTVYCLLSFTCTPLDQLLLAHFIGGYFQSFGCAREH